MEDFDAVSGSRASTKPAGGLGPTGFDPGELLALAERCELAAGADRELDAEIGAIPAAEFLGFPVGKQPGCQAYTASLDAAMELVPEGAKVTTQNFGAPGPMALVSPNERFTSGATLALALCAAALKARALAPTLTRKGRDA